MKDFAKLFQKLVRGMKKFAKLFQKLVRCKNGKNYKSNDKGRLGKSHYIGRTRYR